MKPALRDFLPSGRTREVVTPEGVALRFEVAPAAERFSAFLSDLFLVFLGTAVLLVLLLVLSIDPGEDPLAAAGVFLAAFLLRHGFFAWFEIRRRGVTPGKRAVGLRVVDRRGGPLTGEAVLARNLTREIEVFLPLLLLVAPGAFFPEAPGWGAAVAGAWLIVLAAMPLFNRDRLRVGDLVAGTMVVRAPQAVLLQDVSARPAAPAAEAIAFTRDHLAIYGTYELQVLEEILRTPDPDLQGLRTVRDRILRKIRWEGKPPDVPPLDFLRAFYDAQRAHLEGRLLLGERKESKSERPARGGKRRP
ncbi:MAG: RDD family protein [Planctomycetaceae bacterium]|nr:RDD family protein [Planctomycetota bacterium]NUN52368.1 RDD family protein [Planctomycetaceae bacterium]